MATTLQFPAPAAIENAEDPRHIAVIMDGNGRWAAARGLPRLAGHRRGVDAVKKLVTGLLRRRIPHLTLFAFSSENWRRPETEVTWLMELLGATIEREIKRLLANQIRLRVIGDLSRFPNVLRRKIAESVAATSGNDQLNLTVALGYGGQWDLAQACRALAESVQRGEIAARDIDAALLESKLCTAGSPPPDLFIRTGGEQRISNFLLWQLAYTELYFTDAFWPDFDESHLARALEIFARRQRRFGQTGEQVRELQA